MHIATYPTIAWYRAIACILLPQKQWPFGAQLPVSPTLRILSYFYENGPLYVWRMILHNYSLSTCPPFDQSSVAPCKLLHSYFTSISNVCMHKINNLHGVGLPFLHSRACIGVGLCMHCELELWSGFQNMEDLDRKY